MATSNNNSKNKTTNQNVGITQPTTVTTPSPGTPTTTVTKTYYQDPSGRSWTTPEAAAAHGGVSGSITKAYDVPTGSVRPDPSGGSKIIGSTSASGKTTGTPTAAEYYTTQSGKELYKAMQSAGPGAKVVPTEKGYDVIPKQQAASAATAPSIENSMIKTWTITDSSGKKTVLTDEEFKAKKDYAQKTYLTPYVPTEKTNIPVIAEAAKTRKEQMISKFGIKEFEKGIKITPSQQGTKTKEVSTIQPYVPGPVSPEFISTMRKDVVTGGKEMLESANIKVSNYIKPVTSKVKEAYAGYALLAYSPDIMKIPVVGPTITYYGTKLEDKPVSFAIEAYATYKFGKIFGYGTSLISAIGTKSATTVFFGGAALGTAYVTKTALDIASAKTRTEKERIIGTSIVETSLFLKGAKMGGAAAIKAGIEPSPSYAPIPTLTRTEVVSGEQTTVLSRTFGLVSTAKGEATPILSYTSKRPVGVSVLKGEKYVPVKETDLYDLPFRTPEKTFGKFSKSTADISYGLSTIKKGEISPKSLESPFTLKEIKGVSKSRYLTESEIKATGEEQLILGSPTRNVAPEIFDIQKQIISVKGERQATQFPKPRTVKTQEASSAVVEFLQEPKTYLGRSKFVAYGSSVTSQYVPYESRIQFQGKETRFGDIGDIDFFARLEQKPTEKYIVKAKGVLESKGEKVFIPKDETLQIRPAGKEGKILEAHSLFGEEAESAPQKYFGLQFSGRGYSKFDINQMPGSKTAQVITLGESSARYGASVSGYSIRQGKIVQAPQERRLKDLPRMFITTEEAIKQSDFTPSKKAELLVKLEKVKEAYPQRKALEKIEVTKVKETYLSPSPSPAKSYSLGISLPKSKSVEESKSSTPSYSKSPSISKSISPSESISPSKSISPSRSLSPSKSVSTSKYSSSVSSFIPSIPKSISPSKSPSKSTYPSYSPNMDYIKEPQPEIVIGGPPFGIDLFGKSGNIKGGGRSKKKYVASIEATVLNIKGTKSAKRFGEITGLGIRPF